MLTPFTPSLPVKAHLPNLKPRTFTYDDMHEIWSVMRREGKVPILFYDGHVKNAWDYVDFMASPNVFAYAVHHPDSGEPLATYFVNGFIGHAGLLHFCIFDAGLPYARQIGIEGTNFLLRNGGLSALIGITPKPFRHAWNYALSVGFEKMGILPRACHFPASGKRTEGRMVDAVITLCTPQSLLAP